MTEIAAASYGIARSETFLALKSGNKYICDSAFFPEQRKYANRVSRRIFSK